MKATNKYISKTNNQIVKQVLTAASSLIEKQVAAQVKYEERNGQTLGEFAIESIELTLIYDLVKSITNYTLPTDSMVEFQIGMSRKGNLEMHGIVSRDNEKFSFYTEVIIADGMINRRHLRYICKTSLPKQGISAEAKAIKTELAKMNKIQRIQSYIDMLARNVRDCNSKAERIENMTRAEVIAEINESSYPLLLNNWDEQGSDTYLLDRWGSKEAYGEWLNEANEDRIAKFIGEAQHSRNRALRTSQSITKELAKLSKLQ